MSRRAQAALAVIVGAVLGVVSAVIGSAAHADVPWVVTVPAGLSVGALMATLFWLPTSDPVATTPPPSVPRTESASFGDLASLRFNVEQAGRDPERFETRLRPRLTALVTERLWQRHRVDWRTESGREAALAMLPPDLISLLTAPPRSLRLTPKTLTGWLRALEEL